MLLFAQMNIYNMTLITHIISLKDIAISRFGFSLNGTEISTKHFLNFRYQNYTIHMSMSTLFKNFI